MNSVKDPRQFRRYHYLTTLAPGDIFLRDTTRSLNALPVDISLQGLGILTTEPMPVGSQAVLKLPNDQNVFFETRYCQQSFSHPGYFRCGLQIVGDVVKMDDIYPPPAGIKLQKE